MRGSATIAAVMTAVLILSCSTGPLTGNSSETTNGLTVVTKAGLVEGTAPPYASLYLLEDTYDPFSGKAYDSIATDSTGVFRFSAAQGSYNLFCRETGGLRSRTRVTVITGSPYTIDEDTIRDTLVAPGSLQGYAPRNGSRTIASYLYLEGSPYFTLADSNTGYFRIDDIPEGRYTVRRYSVTRTEAIISDTLDTLSSESTTVIGIVSDSVLTMLWGR